MFFFIADLHRAESVGRLKYWLWWNNFLY